MAEQSTKKRVSRRERAQSELETRAKLEKKKIFKQADIDESYLIGILWSNPFEYYGEYSRMLDAEDFLHDVWSFYYRLGQLMYDDGIKDFDAITVYNYVKKNNHESLFEEYGKMRTVEELIEIAREGLQNIEHYYDTVKKNAVVRDLINLYGDKVITDTDKYKYKETDLNILIQYWQDKTNKIAMSTIKNNQAVNALIPYKEFRENLKQNSANMMDMFCSPNMNGITAGVAKGHVSMLGGFGGTGKTSIAVDKIVMSYIMNREKAMIILNEEDADSFRTKIALRLLKYLSNGKKKIKRRHMTMGTLTEQEDEYLEYAFDEWDKLAGGDDSLLQIIYMEKYIMRDVEKQVRYYANRGYDNLLIDTHKVSDESQYDQRWQTFVEDMKTIYRLTKQNGGGLNLRTIVTFQLADSAIHNRFLDFEAIGEGKASKNEASVVYMFRNVWADEYSGGKNQLLVEGVNSSRLNPKQKDQFYLEEGTQYYLFFYPKNRFGASTEGAGKILVLKPEWETNSFEEIGWVTVGNDKSGR